MCQLPPSTTTQKAVVKVFSDEDRVGTCTSCLVYYNYNSTPQLMYLLPNAGNPGDQINYYGIERVNSSIYVDYLKIGNDRCDASNQNEYNPTAFSVNAEQQSSCNVPYIEAGYYNVSQMNMVSTGLASNLNTLSTYKFNGTSYNFAIIPQITWMTNNKGSPFGQILTVYGVGFSSTGQNEVYYGDTKCIIKSQSDTQIDFEVLPRSKPVVPQAYHAGLKFEFYDGATMASVKAGTAGPPTSSGSRLTAEIPVNMATYFASTLSGYFKAPVTGNYTFFLSADDQAELLMSRTPINTTSLESIIYLGSWTQYKFFYNKFQYSQASQEIYLTAGNSYYMKLYHGQFGGLESASIGVLIPNTSNSVSNPAEVQAINITCPRDYEVLEFKLMNVNGGYWGIRFDYISSDGKQITKTLYTTNMTYNALNTTVSSSISSATGYSNQVIRQLLKADGNITTNLTETVAISYQVTFLGVRDNGILPSIDKSGLTGTQISVKVTQLQAPSDLLQGTFSINYNGKTIQLAYDVAPGTLQTQLRALGFLDPIRVVQYGDARTGLEWRIQFTGDSGKPINPLVVTSGLTGCRNPSNISINVITLQQSTQDLFYETIPSDLLATFENTPQVTVKSNGVLASCPSLNCDYVIQSDVGLPQIISSTQAGTTIKLIVNNVASGDFMVYFIIFSLGPYDCQIITYDDNNTPVIVIADCPTPEAGEFFPTVHFGGFGYAKTGPSIQKIIIEVTISSITPSTINPNGGTDLIITGSGFPLTLDGAQASGLGVTIGATSCILTSVSPTEIQCTTVPISAAAPLFISLNGKNATSAVLNLLSNVPKISNISPNRANPVLQTDIVITGTNFDTSAAQTKVLLRNRADSTQTECLVASSSATQIKCKLLGAPTGNYSLTAQTSLGYTQAVNFEVSTIITSISPSNGSMAGGTIITIQGGTFSPDITQTQVYIGDDNIVCDVISSTSTQVKCQTRAKSNNYAETPQGVYVDTRIVEEAVCPSGVSCTFSYLKSLTPNISSLNSTQVVPGTSLKMSGAQLNSTPIGISPIVTLNGLNCTVLSSNNTQISILIPVNFAPTTSATLVVFVSGKGYAQFTTMNGTISVIPTISSISPATASSSGALLTLTGAGFQQGAIVTVGTSLCAIRSLTTSTIVCKANSTGEVSLQYNEFKNIKLSTAYSLTFNSSLTPNITAVSPLNLPTGVFFNLTINGSELSPGTTIVNLISTFDTTISFAGSVLLANSTVIVASFANITAGSYQVEVIINSNFASDTFIINSPLSVNSTAPVPSSIAGGANLNIYGAGFFKSSLNSQNSVSVCGFPCNVIQSTEKFIQCVTPAFINSAVLANYPEITSSSQLNGTSWSDVSNEAVVFDATLTTTYSSKTQNCQIGFDVGEGLIAELGQIKFFPDPAITPSTLNGTLIEGSNDNLTYSVIYTLDWNTNNGWNTITLDSISSSSAFRYYRLRGATSTAYCALAELQFFGIKLSANAGTDLTSLSCSAKVTVNNKSVQIPNAVTYTKNITPVLSSISPIMGTSAGGTTLTLTGKNFITNVAQISVKIDNVPCNVTTVTLTEITCTTGAAPILALRTNSLESKLTIFFSGKGYSVTNGIQYFYVDRWSDTNTWGGIVPPREGESVSIASGQTILLDISPPQLKAIIIEGALIFDDANINLNCEYILIDGGRLQIGTWEEPIQSQVTVTLYGNKDSAQLPTFGNKVVANMGGVIDIHGMPRDYTWTVLETTANVGDNSIVVQGNVDWLVGEQIVIASTDHNQYHSESLVIIDVSLDTPVFNTTTITFWTSLNYEHYAGIQIIDGVTFEMRAEVALLSRNIIVQGDDTSERLKYGVHIMSSSNDDSGAIARVSYTEIRQAGQAYSLGRYPIHFDLIGDAQDSYVIGNAVHHSYNRAITIHGVNFLRVQNNVAYWCMGHTIFIEDGVETYNLIEDNLVINTIASMSLLNTDQTPASFWITNPNNIWRRNRAAGSDSYGFWFNLKSYAQGSSATNSFCPLGMPLGEFSSNQAHSNGRYGLRIFPEFTPRTYPCLAYQPYDQNPPIQAEFKDFLGWKNGRDAVIGEALGAVKFKNILSANNLRAGIEISSGGNRSPFGTCLVENAWLVGMTNENAGNSTLYEQGMVRGLITPRVDNFLARNVHFYNYGSEMSAIETCSHCEYSSATDAGARTSFFEGIVFKNVSQRTRFNVPYKEILIDNDGSLTNNTIGGKGVITYFYDHLNVPGCKRNNSVFNGLVCNETVMIRRIELYSVSPSASFQLQNLEILRIESNPQALFGAIPYRQENRQSWAVPFVTGYTYQLSWASRADFSSLIITPYQISNANDKPITIMFNHSAYRETFDVLRLSSPTVTIENSTTLWNSKNVSTKLDGDWYHDVTNRSLYMTINGRQNSRC